MSVMNHLTQFFSFFLSQHRRRRKKLRNRRKKLQRRMWIKLDGVVVADINQKAFVSTWSRALNASVHQTVILFTQLNFFFSLALSQCIDSSI